MRDWTISGPKCCGLAGYNTTVAAEGGKKSPIFISDPSSVTEQMERTFESPRFRSELWNYF